MNDTTRDAIRSALTAFIIAVLLGGSIAMVAVARTFEMGPQVGDILVFRRGIQVPAEWEFAAVMHSNELPVSCKLQPQDMVSGGGSLVVVQRSDSRRVYRVHWAGERTSGDPTNCGNIADLLLGRGDLQLLSNAAGGSISSW